MALNDTVAEDVSGAPRIWAPRIAHVWRLRAEATKKNMCLLFVSVIFEGAGY